VVGLALGSRRARDHDVTGIAQRGGEVLLDREGVRSAWVAVQIALKAGGNDGIAAPLHLSRLLEVLEAARDVGSASGTPEVPHLARPALSSLIEPTTVKEVAEMLQCSERNVTQLCAAGRFLTARKIGRSWQIEHAEALSYAQAPGRRSA
jgi:hypothetical protein